MMFKTMSGREYKIDIRPSKWPRKDKENCKSKLQWETGQIIDTIHPGQLVLEEFSIPGERLYIDFFLPRKKIAVEVMGEQHERFNKFFHGTKEAFIESKRRDVRKRDWCGANGISLIYINYDSKPEDITKALKE